MSLPIVLLPKPRQSHPLAEGYTLPQQATILISTARAQDLVFTALRLRQKLAEASGLDWDLSASPAIPAGQVGVALRLAPETGLPREGYRLRVTPAGVEIQASDAAGIYYATCTLVQIVQQSGRSLPGLDILDWPDFAVRGVMLDISRDKVPTMDTLYNLVDRLSTWKFNQFQLYTEHAFAYRNHPVVWAKASPVTGEEILVLDAYCRERFIELVPNQNSFSHMDRWLSHPEYSGLGEISGSFESPYGTIPPFSLCPSDPGSLALIDSLYDELLPHFTSHMVNAGCDETFELGFGRSKAEVDARGEGPVYLEHLLKIYRTLQRRGYRMQFWGDVLIRHPDLVRELPRDIIALEWGYEANHPFEEHGAEFAAAGVPFYVCPGTSSWNTIAGRTDNALGNLRSAAENGLRYGACGYLITDWGDNGHWQVLPISYLGYAAGAAYSWAYEANLDLDLRAAVSRFAFDDPSGAMGSLAYELGNVYKTVSYLPENYSALFRILQKPTEYIQKIAAEIPGEFFFGSEAAIDQAMSNLADSQMSGLEANLIEDEFRQTAALLRHAVRRGRWLLEPSGGEGERKALNADLSEIIANHSRLWLARNRPGGLEDSLSRFETAKADYA